jgi:hypothetical protein
VKEKIYSPYIQKLYQKSIALNERYAAPLPCVSVPAGNGIQRLKYWLKGILKPNKLIHISDIS